MKNVIKIFLVGMFLIGSTISCSDSERSIDELYDTVDTGGAFIRTLEQPLGLVNVTDPEKNTIESLIEIQEGNGSVDPDFKEVRMYIQTFQDQDQIDATVDTSGNPTGESLLATFPASDFTPSDVSGLPSTNLSVMTQSILDSNPNTVFTFPTFIFLRLELEMNDGTVYTNTNVGPTVASGNYFLASFFYNIIFLPN